MLFKISNLDCKRRIHIRDGVITSFQGAICFSLNCKSSFSESRFGRYSRGLGAGRGCEGWREGGGWRGGGGGARGTGMRQPLRCIQRRRKGGRRRKGAEVAVPQRGGFAQGKRASSDLQTLSPAAQLLEQRVKRLSVTGARLPDPPTLPKRHASALVAAEPATTAQPLSPGLAERAPPRPPAPPLPSEPRLPPGLRAAVASPRSHGCGKQV